MIDLIIQLRALGYRCDLWQMPGMSGKGVIQCTIMEPGAAQGATTYIGADWTLQHALLHIDGKRQQFLTAVNK